MENHIIVVIENDGKAREYNLSNFNKDKISFGRDPSNDIVLKSITASKFHGAFYLKDEHTYVADFNSTNGTCVNSYSIGKNCAHHSTQLIDGDIVRINNIDTKAEGCVMCYTKHINKGAWRSLNLTQNNRYTIGRVNDNNIIIQNMTISRHHAVIYFHDGHYFINDTNSKNGVFVNGMPVYASVRLKNRDVVSIGTSLLIFVYNTILYKAPANGTKLVMKSISRTVKARGNSRYILQDVNLTIEPNEFVAIVGGSGAGKSTVMNAMSGFERADYGDVYVNGINLYDNYQILKNIIGYVPQSDIIYDNLTLRSMLSYTAQMRMPDDASHEERESKIDEILEMVDLTEHKDRMIKVLSGGQRKRASIAVELLAEPSLFFLDEPTSGLDPGTESNLMRTLSKLSKERQKTIIMVTHCTRNLFLCDKILFMGKGGRVCFFGSPRECLDFFGVDDIADVYNLISSDDKTNYYTNKYESMYFERVSGDVPKTHESVKSVKKPSFLKQLSVLTSRYMNLIVNDRQRLFMTIVQPIVISILLAAVAESHVYDLDSGYNDTKSILFSLSCAGIWMGLFNSIQEICKERVILRREYMANLRLDAYVLSKYIVQFLMSVLQSVLLMIGFIILIGTPDNGIVLASPIEMMLTITITIFSASTLGLTLSAISKNVDMAMTMAPFVLIIQLLFSGILFTLSGFSKFFANVTISKWAFGALGTTANMNALKSTVDLTGDLAKTIGNTITVNGLEVEVCNHSVSNLVNCWMAMLIFAIVCCFVSVMILKNISKDTR